MSPSFLPPGAWEAFLLFLIPVGSGIPGGVLVAHAHGIGWPVMEALYFVSDAILACVFEPCMHLIIAGGRRVPRLARMTDALRKITLQTTSLYGSSGGPFTLILIAFGVDPMTGRTAAAAAGHGFVSGWTLAIAGDMLYFSLIMASTLWLKSILGDGRWTTITILVLMFVVPLLIQRWKKSRST